MNAHDDALPRLARLSRLRDLDVAPHEPDPRGWTVVSRDGRSVGEVKDLIVDTDRMTATYLDVELDTKLFDFRDDDPHVMVPIERAHRTGRRVLVDDITSSWVSELRAARELHQREFWDRWWQRGEAGRGPRIARRVDPGELDRVVDGLRPGESARIPLVEEEIIVERRPVPPEQAPRDYQVVNRAADEPPLDRR